MESIILLESLVSPIIPIGIFGKSNYSNWNPWNSNGFQLERFQGIPRIPIGNLELLELLESNWKEIPKIRVFLVKDSIKFFQLEFLGILRKSKEFQGIPIGKGHCETRRVVKSNPKGCNVIIPMGRVVFRDCCIYNFFHCKINSTN